MKSSTMKTMMGYIAPVLALAAVLTSALPALALDAAGMKKLLESIDERQRNSGDFKNLVLVQNKEKGKDDVVLEAVIYRRDKDDKFMLLFLNPKAERGKGYLRIDKNLWLYDPGVGRWERRTERERIAGTDTRRADFDESRLAEEFAPEYVGQEALGKFTVHHLKLTAKANVDVAYPIVEMWVDTATGNILKRQEFALSGKLMRTTYTPKWKKVYSESKAAEVWYPAEIRIFDEVEKGNQTTVVIQSVDMRALPENIFSKAWLEGQSR